MTSAVYRANRILVGFWVVLFFAFGAAMLWPPVVARIREGNLGHIFVVFDWLPADVRLAAFYALALLLAVAGVSMARFLFDPRIMTISDQGITVRHPFATHSGSWRDFVEVKMVGIGRRKQPRLIFGDGPSPEGGPNKRKLALPTPIFGLNLNAVVADVMVRAAAAQVQSRVRPRQTAAPR